MEILKYLEIGKYIINFVQVAFKLELRLVFSDIKGLHTLFKIKLGLSYNL